MLEQDGSSFAVKVSNVSEKGALVIGESMPAAGSPVVFRRDQLAIASRVAWIDRNHAGIEFDEALPLEELLRHVRAPQPVPQLRYRRPGLKDGA